MVERKYYPLEIVLMLFIGRLGEGFRVFVHGKAAFSPIRHIVWGDSAGHRTREGEADMMQ